MDWSFGIPDLYEDKFGAPFWPIKRINAVDFSAPFAFVYGMDSWLYGTWNKEKYETWNVLSHLPVVGDYMDTLLDSRNTEEYLDRYGLDYPDIHDPRKLPGGRSSVATVGMDALNFVSKNIDKLYRN